MVPTSEAAWRKLLSDPKVSAIAVRTRRYSGAGALADAIVAGKHVWVEEPAIESEEQAAELDRLARASRRVLFAGPAAQSNGAWGLARSFAMSAQSGLAFCRVADSDGGWLAHAQIALGHPSGQAITPAIRRSIVRYPGVTVACERALPGGEGVWFHGAAETLAITPSGIARHSNAGARNFSHPSSEQTWKAHWAAFRAAIEHPPAPALAGEVRSALIRRALDLRTL